MLWKLIKYWLISVFCSFCSQEGVVDGSIELCFLGPRLNSVILSFSRCFNLAL